MMKHLPPIYLLRHGETEWNREGRLQGRMDSPLTEKGLAQARKMAATLEAILDRSLDWKLVSSPQLRARRTAEAVADQCKFPITEDERLREASMGQWEGLTGAEIDAGWPEFVGIFRFLITPGGETISDVSARVSSWFESLQGPTIAVSHGVTGRVIRGLYLGVDATELPSMAGANQDGLFRLENGAATFIDCIEHSDAGASA